MDAETVADRSHRGRTSKHVLAVVMQVASLHGAGGAAKLSTHLA